MKKMNFKEWVSIKNQTLCYLDKKYEKDYDFDNSFFVIYFTDKKHYLTDIYKNGSIRTYERVVSALRFNHSPQLFLYLEYCDYKGYKVEIKQLVIKDIGA